ncbi:MAG: ComF family protein [bacterium]|nr:ComF family protein [bacterium]
MDPRGVGARALGCLVAPVSAFVELMLPEECAACGATSGHAEWEPGGVRVAGLRPWDRPHLCCACAGGLFAEPCTRMLDADGCERLTIRAASPTSARLTRVVGTWKYHGVRGLAWPFARALAAAAHTDSLASGATAEPAPGSPPTLVAVPLHARRQRARGFNQAQMLAELAAPLLGLEVLRDALVRTRVTAQQARLTDAAARRQNLDGAFAASAPRADRRRALLVDDLVTAGATARAAAAALRAAGWEVSGVLALGLALARADGDDAGDADPTGGLFQP